MGLLVVGTDYHGDFDERLKKLIGRDQAERDGVILGEAVSAIRCVHVGLKNPNRPIASINLCAAPPPGVGKSQLAEALANHDFRSKDAMAGHVAFMERQTVSKLIGSPPGCIGYQESVQLAEVVRWRQYTVMLFDEIEKAYPDVFNMTLQTHPRSWEAAGVRISSIYGRDAS